MSKPPKIKNNIKEIVISFLKDLYEKKQKGSVLSFVEENTITSKISLVQYARDQYKKMYNVQVSESSVDKAITELITVEKSIEFADGCYQYCPQESSEKQTYPVLKIAKDISIESLPFDNFCFFKVDENYVVQVAEYLNAHFYSDDIRVIPLGTLLLCLDISLPEESRYITKKRDLYSRVSKYLKKFRFEELKVNDKNIKGITEEDVVIEQSKDDFEPSNYGGTITNHPKRKIKK